MSSDVYLELFKAEPWQQDENCTLSEGVATCRGTHGRSAEYRWTPPPKIIERDGFDMTLSIALAGGEYGSNGGAIAINTSGFRFGPDNNYSFDVNAEAPAGKNASNSSTFRVRPTSEAYADGPSVSFSVGAGDRGSYWYVYQVKTRKGPAPQLTASIDDCPASIEISAYPPLNCHIKISGFQHDTADEVKVSFPMEIDTFGNHENGIQLSGRGSLSVYNMDDPYSWGLFIFACPSQKNAGMNCYDSVTEAGTTVTVPIVVSQKGAGEVRLNLSFNAVAHGGGSGTGTVARIGNRQRAGDFINIETGTLVGGPIKFDWEGALWEIEPMDRSEFVRIRSKKQPELYLNIESGELEAAIIREGQESAEWKLVPVDDTRYIRIQSRSSDDQFIHMRNGTLEAGAIESKWWSAMWWLQE